MAQGTVHQVREVPAAAPVDPAQATEVPVAIQAGNPVALVQVANNKRIAAEVLTDWISFSKTPIFRWFTKPRSSSVLNSIQLF